MCQLITQRVARFLPTKIFFAQQQRYKFNLFPVWPKVWFWTATTDDLPACFRLRFVKSHYWITARSKCTVQRSAGSITKWFPVPVWLFGCAHAAAVHLADCSPENVKLSTTASIKLSGSTICLVYMCQQGTLVDRTNPQSLNCFEFCRRLCIDRSVNLFQPCYILYGVIPSNAQVIFHWQPQ